MAPPKRRFNANTTLLCAAACLLSVARSEQLDIVISETASDEVSISVQGSLDLASGAAFLGDGEAESTMPPFVKVGHSADGSADFSLIDMQTTAMAYYLVDGDETAWGFDCIDVSTDLFANAGSSIGNSIGFFVTKLPEGDTPAILLSKDEDYSNVDEKVTIAVSSVGSLGLVADSTCFMAFGKNRIQLQVIGGADEADDVSNLAPTESPSLRPVGTKSEAPPAISTPTDVEIPSPVTETPTEAPETPSCDWLCAIGNFVGISSSNSD